MAKYRDAIAWIAINDEPSSQDVEEMSEIISVLLVADLWGKEPEHVAQDVVKLRTK